MDGILIIDKPKDYTSRDIVNIISKTYHTKKVGHTGTLDPLATGVLTICVGNATKIVEILTSDDKEYIATFKFGILTDTLDSEGTVLKNEKCELSKKDILEAMKKITGTYMQEVPIYSAVKVNGRKLYEYAREGSFVELPKHKVTISSLELLDYKIIDNHTVTIIKCHVSKGTYIRSLGNDIAYLLGTNAIMTDLRRTKQGIFNIEDCLQLEEINSETKLLSIVDYLKMYKKVVADNELEKKILNGSILENIYLEDKILFVDSDEMPIALYEKYDKEEGKIKPWKMFKNTIH